MVKRLITWISDNSTIIKKIKKKTHSASLARISSQMESSGNVATNPANFSISSSSHPFQLHQKEKFNHRTSDAKSSETWSTKISRAFATSLIGRPTTWHPKPAMNSREPKTRTMKHCRRRRVNRKGTLNFPKAIPRTRGKSSIELRKIKNKTIHPTDPKQLIQRPPR